MTSVMKTENRKKIRVLIVDDEVTAREGIQLFLASESDVEIVGECANGLEAVSAIRNESPDLILLDVQMPGMTGFQIIEEVGIEQMPAVIFVTAYDKYAVKAFEVHALDYLLKPFDKTRLLKSLERSRSKINNPVQDEANRQLFALIKEFKDEQMLDQQKHPVVQKYQDRMVIKKSGRISFINVQEIDSIEAADNYVKLNVGRESHLIRGTISGLESKLDPSKFLRIRRSTLVNVGRIKELHPLFNGEYGILLLSGRELVSSRRFRNNIKVLLGE